jgi:hypothetical protein
MADLEQKIHEPDLRRFAKSKDAKQQRSVIVELEAPPAKLSAPMNQGTLSSSYSRELLPESAQEVDGGMERLENYLRSIAEGGDIIRLGFAQAFVIEASPKQLRSIAKLSEVGAIRPNRTHRVSTS